MTAETGSSGYVLLSEYLDRPEMLDPPPVVVPHLAWRGRVTLLAAAEKGGKSTLIGQAAAACSTGTTFLGQDVEPCSVAWIALDEHVSDLVRRLSHHGAKSGIGIYNRRPAVELLDSDLKDLRPGLLVIDTLTRYALGEVTEGGSRFQWAPLMAYITEVARIHNVAIVLLHHFARSSERYAESAEIGASVDQIIEMRKDGESPTVRLLKSEGRIVFESLKVEYQYNRYERFDGRPPSLDALILAQLSKEPGLTVGGLRKAVGKRMETVLAEVMRMESAGLCYRQNGGRNAERVYIGRKPQVVSE